MSVFYVLEEYHRDGLGRETTFGEEPPWNRGEPLLCSVCLEPVSLLPWLPPYRAELECRGTEFGDLALDGGEGFLVSERFKLLYDIYHMQIMEGDVIRTIRDNIDHIGHFHTGGVPGRHEIDETQELYYPSIMRAIVETVFTGFTAQEFIPARDPMTSLREAVRLCDV